MAASGDAEWWEHRDALSSPAARSSWGLQQSSLASSQTAPRRQSLRPVSPMRASREDGGAGQSVWYVCGRSECVVCVYSVRLCVLCISSIRSSVALVVA